MGKTTQDIVKAAENVELSETNAWTDLSLLSSNTQIDGIEVDPAGIIIKNNDFEGIMSIYVVLSYGSGEDSFDDTDTFTGTFYGHLEGGQNPIIDNVEVDTTPFYGESPIEQP